MLIDFIIIKWRCRLFLTICLVLGRLKIFFTYHSIKSIKTFSVPFFNQGAKTWNGIKNFAEFFRILVTGTEIKIESYSLSIVKI
jgi:hypothetical protein